MIIAVVDQRRERSLPAGMTKEDIIKKELYWSKPLRLGHRNKANTAEGLALRNLGTLANTCQAARDTVPGDKDAVSNTTI